MMPVAILGWDHCKYGTLAAIKREFENDDSGLLVKTLFR
jgi:hypothetical protein